MTRGAEHDIEFHCMGSDMRLLVGEPIEPGLPAPETRARVVRRFLEDFDRRLSRFRADSELSRFNRDPRHVVPASMLLRAGVRAAVWAAERTDGLVDPTLVGELEHAGYAHSRDGVQAVPVTEAIAAAPPSRPASPSRESRWRAILVNERGGTIERPPSLRIDSGGVGKGLAADMAAELLRGYARFVVDCGGDIRVGGPDAQADPYRIEVEHPLTGARVIALRLPEGGVATSGINVRIWRDDSGRVAHHLLDPVTGEPAWTGLVGATAIGATALEAETLAKAALLSGPERARRWLAELGGVLIHDDGEVEYVGLHEVRPAEVRFRLPEEWRHEPVQEQRSTP
jgi:FAD:protein FMN transferase